MTLSPQQMLELANQSAEQSEVDMSQESTGGGGIKLFPAQYARARLVRYLELGKQAREFGGKAKEPALEVRLGFALFDADPDAAELEYGYKDDTGAYRPGIFNPYSLSISNNVKAKAKIAFDKMNYKGTAKSFAQLLGQTFLIKLDVAKSKDGKREYNVIDWAATMPPVDPMNPRKRLEVPSAPEDMYQIFLWNMPTQDTWDSLFIDGKREDGSSKNFLQETCLKATDFEGSALQLMLAGGGGDVPSAPAEPSNTQQQSAELPEEPTEPEIPTDDIPF